MRDIQIIGSDGIIFKKYIVGVLPMSKLKEKKIRKLRKKSIWPSILGLLFLLCVFSLIILISMASSCLDIVQRKLNEGSDQAARIAKLFEEYDEESAKGVQDAVLAYMALSKEVESVGIIDEAGKKIWSSDGHYPNIENISQIDLQQDNSGANVHVILEEDANQWLLNEERELIFEAIEKIKSDSYQDALNRCGTVIDRLSDIIENLKKTEEKSGKARPLVTGALGLLLAVLLF